MRFVRLALIACLATAAFAAVVGSVRGIIHDPQHRPVQNAMVMIKAKSSDWSATTNSDANGKFVFTAVPARRIRRHRRWYRIRTDPRRSPR